ncbi:hypothetical protein BJ992_004322 [Sphaerisporangium rubeum]|uniref:STAS domain-containing protein n=1 Tax=Sphaerisporangium rubeum TaxID=321317 RepID=A0A7X0M9F6_9ACTN|nr:hypothetical protein [Sphaerisporangium rubeum]
MTTAWDAPGVDALVLDLTGVGFCDSVGLSELISVLRRSHETGVPLRVAGVHGTLLRILTITGLYGSFEMYDDLGTALGLPPGSLGPGGGSGGGPDGGSVTPAGETADRPARDIPPSAVEWRSLPPDPGDLVPAT